jgi:CheY-like chemotaxis protein
VRSGGGTGLGLAIARQLAALMGGRMGAVPRDEGGSVFSFTARLPRVRGRADAAPARTELGGLRALIVDDNPTNRTILEHYLAAWGLVCHSVEGAQQALEVLVQAHHDGQPYRLAVLDYHMPGMDGIELAQRIRARRELRDTAIVLLTSSVTDIQVAEQAEVKQHLLKPPRQSDLYDAIADALSGESAGQARTLALRDTIARQRSVASGPLVLVAEDNQVNELLATTMLRRRGLRPEMARTGLEAVRMATTREYAAIFMDCQMPEIDGYEATRRIRVAETDRHLPIIAMTANAMPGDRDRCLAAGMDDYLPKPVSPSQLDRALLRWLPDLGQTTGETQPADTMAPDHSSSNHGAPPTGPAPNTGELLDLEVVQRIRVDLDHSMRGRLMSTFERSLQECVSGIEGAARDRDGDELRRVAHLLKGSSATIGAARLRETCEALERLALAGEPTLAEASVGTLASIAEHTRSALASELLAA